MAKVRVLATRDVNARPDRVLAVLRDYRAARPRILPGNYTAYRVEQGGQGDGTVIAYHFAAGRRERDYRLRVEESGSELRERDELSSFVTTWKVAPAGAGSTVTLESSWDGAGGIGGFFERTFAPIGLRRIYGEMLDRLAATAQSETPAAE
jgi:Polyketide cyclase / dehydrase and lipid transport